MTNKEWADGLRKQINNTKDYPFYDEITGCLEAGFLRSAYVMSWVGIAENLKDKILELSNLGDAAATTALTAIQDAEANKKSVDKIILEKAGALSLVEATELANLEFLWTQRCIFAHPYQLAPNEDETKFIINQLVNICLSKPLLYKRTYLTELINNLVTKPFFLSNNEADIIKFFTGILSRVLPDQHPYLFKTLLFELGKVEVDDAKADTQLKLRIFLGKLLNETPTPLSDVSWGFENRAVNYPFTTLYGCVTVNTWSKLPERVKQILVDYALGEADESKRFRIKTAFWELIGAGVLEEPFRQRYFTYLESIRFTYAIHFYADTAAMLGRILRDFSTFNYDKQNAVIEFLKSESGKNYLAGLQEADQSAIGNHLMFAVRNNNWSGADYLNSLTAKNDLPKAFVKGILDATILNRNNDFYVDLERFRIALKMLENLTAGEATQLVTDLDARVIAMPADKTHHAGDDTIEALKLKMAGIKAEVKEPAELLLDHLKNYQFKWADLG